MYLFLIILASGLINALASKDLDPREQKDDLLYYKRFVEEKILVENIRQIRVNNLNPEELADYINQWEQISNVNFLISKHLGIGHALYRLGNYDKAIVYHTNAFEKGFDIEHLRAVNVDGIYDTLKSIFPAARNYYFNSIETNLRNTLRQMQIRDQSYRSMEGFSENQTYRKRQHEIDSANIEKLKKITSDYGWPGRQLIGWHPDKTNGRRLPPSPNLMVIHSCEFYNYYFLERIIKSCAANQESWTVAEGVMQSLLRRFERIDNHNKLRYIFIDDVGMIDFDRSLLLLNSLLVLMEFNPVIGFSLHLTDMHPTQDAAILNTIKDFLTQRGIQDNRIVISEKVIESIPEELGDYYVATKSIYL